MIQIDGTDYAQPSDFPVVAYTGGDYVLVTIGDTIKRVAISEFEGGGPFAPLGHVHADETITPASIINQTIKVGWSEAFCFKYNADRRAYLTAVSLSITTSDYNPVTIQVGVPNQFTIAGTPGIRSALADAWNLYPCSKDFKTDVASISEPLVKISKASGITYVQDGVSGVGITAEDLEAVGLPGLVTKNPKGEYESINPTGLIPLLLQAVKELSEKVLLLEGSTAVGGGD